MQLIRRQQKQDLLPDVERFLDDFWKPLGLLPRMDQWMPRVDVVEGEKEYRVTADVPGVDPKDIVVETAGNTLTISGKSTSEQREEKDKYFRVERQTGEFSRSFTLPVNVDTDGITAEDKHGTVTVRIPKTAESQPETKRIEVKS